MSIELPSVAVIRTGLERLSHAQMQRLARVSGVPFTTIWKIRDGTTKNPGLETVGLFVRHIESVTSAPAIASTQPSDARFHMGEGA